MQKGDLVNKNTEVRSNTIVCGEAGIGKNGYYIIPNIAKLLKSQGHNARTAEEAIDKYKLIMSQKSSENDPNISKIL